MRAITISYHDVVQGGDYDASGFSGEGPATYKLRTEQFDEQMEALARAQCEEPVLIADIVGTVRPVCLAFDDGGTGAAIAAQVLERQGWRGHFFITTDLIGKASFLSKNEIVDLAERGHVIGSHSCSHPDPMSALSRPELLREWRVSKDILEGILGKPVTTASIPGGFYSRSVAQAASDAGYRFLFTSEPRTRTWTVGSCTVLGRYTIKNNMAADTMVRLVEEGSGERLRQGLIWNMKKVAKKFGGNLYFSARRRLLRNRIQDTK